MKRVRYRQLTDIHSVLGEGTRALLNFIEKQLWASAAGKGDVLDTGIRPLYPH